MEKIKKFLIYFLLTIFGIALARHFIQMPIISIVFISTIVFWAYKLDLQDLDYGYSLFHLF